MKLLSLLTVAIVLIGITTQACNYERMSRIPNYAEIGKPKQALNIPQAQGICVAPNGNFAVVSWNKAGKIYLYLSCGKPLIIVDLRKQGLKNNGEFGDCAYTKHRLYVTDTTGKIYELSTYGKLLRVFTTGKPSFRIISCQHNLYVTSRHKSPNVVIYDKNGKVMDKFSIPGETRGVLVGIDDILYVSKGNNKEVYTRNLLDDDVNTAFQAAATITYKEIKYADGIAMDTAGNLLIADHGGKVLVYGQCGALIKTITTTGGGAVDVDIGNDGTIMVAVPSASKVLLY